MRIVPACFITLLFTTSLPASAKPHSHTKPLSVHQQLAAKDAVIADLRQQVQYLTGEVETLKARLPTADAALPSVSQSITPTNPIPAPMSNDAEEVILTNKIAGERLLNDRYVLIHGNPPDGDPDKRNPYMDNILKWDWQLINLYKQDIAKETDPVRQSEKERLLNETRNTSGLDLPQ